MSLPHERTRSVIQTESFLVELSRNMALPEELRLEAKRLLRHYPSAEQIMRVGHMEQSLQALERDSLLPPSLLLHDPVFCPSTEF
ncbi:BPSL0761 family protein [Geopseudomonas aromaticivorans]